MGSLCIFCSQIKFDLLGFHGPIFYPNEPFPDDEDDIGDYSPRPSWRVFDKLDLSTILERKKSCHCCKTVVQLLESRLQTQDTIPRSLHDLAAAGAAIQWGYRNEPAYRSDHPDWELTRLEFGLELPKLVVETLRTKFGLKSHDLDPVGPNVFVVLQPADHTVSTVDDSIKAMDDYQDANGDPRLPANNWAKGRLRPCVFDISIVNYWRDICEEQHGRYSDSPCREGQRRRVTGPFGILLPDYLALRVIDVRKRCIVDLKPNSLGFHPKYYALSYIWGSRPFLTLNKSNESELRVEGALSQEAIPDTIADAMTVVTELDERYLWVDSLCILQDDEADKKRLINRMGTIYKDADMTIIALCGRDAYAGLPGVRKDRPRTHQQEINIQGISMLPVMMLTGWAETYKLGETLWTTRGWTFQETVLSHRRLIFGREQVHFACREAVFCEDVIGPDYSPFIDLFGRLQLFGSSASDLTDNPDYNLQNKFRDLTAPFTKRQLSQRKDRLSAFSGILEEMEELGGPFFQGIPQFCFSNSILWDRDFLWSGWPKINESSCQEERALRIPELPSWSWVGWMCDIRYAKDFGDKPVNGSLKFYGYDPDEGLKELKYDRPKIHPLIWSSRAMEESKSEPQGVLPKEFWSSERTEIVLEDIPVLTHKIPLLCFWTSTAFVDLRVVGRKNCFKTRMGKDVSLGLRISIQPEEVKRIELIVLGDLSYVRQSGTAAVAVIAVRWDGEIAYREPFGLEVIEYSDWLEIDGRCWKKIILS